MEFIRSLRAAQKAALLIMVAVILVFAVIYPITASKVGFAYRGEIFVPKEVNGSTVYEASLNGKPASFTVAANGSVTYRYADTVHGPYTAREDPTAIPDRYKNVPGVTGVELYCGEKSVFRGGVENTAYGLQLYKENGRDLNAVVSTSVSSAGMAPSADTVLKLMDGPELTHKGHWGMFLLGLVLCIITALTVIFEDALFQFQMFFRVRDPYSAEPSGWELMTRYISWYLLLLCAALIFAKGLQL